MDQIPNQPHQAPAVYDAPEVAPTQEKQIVPNEQYYVGQPQYAAKQDYVQQTQSYHYPPPVQVTPPKPTICGLRKVTFIIFAVILGIIVVGAAVGGGVGGALSHKSKSSPSLQPSSATGTESPNFSLTTTWPSAATPTMGTFNCPSENGTIYHPANNNSASFLILCRNDFIGGSLGVNGGSVEDLLSVIATSFSSCMDQCVLYSQQTGIECAAVAYGANITLALDRGTVNGNCFLKNQRGKKASYDTTGQTECAYLINP